jgi:malonyl-CoA decarboxylase
MNQSTAPGLFDRTIERLGRALRGAADRLSGEIRPDLPAGDISRLRRQIDDCLAGKGGEVSARARAAELGRSYLGLTPAGRVRFLELLIAEYGIDRPRLDAAITALWTERDDSRRPAAEAELRAALIPARMKLLTQFNAVPEGVKFLVDLRAELLELLPQHPGLAELDNDLEGLLANWFDIGFLDLEPITWNAPAALLEKLIAYEAVHAISSWSDLKNRLDSDRRCYAFFHPRMPNEPLIFVEVALVAGMAASVQELLDVNAPALDATAADSAIFYSISNCQRGLAGVSFGNFLIKRVVDKLRRELPNLRRFATLSPLPGFRAWLDERIAAGDTALLEDAEQARLADLAGEGASGPHALARLLARQDWPRDPAVAEALLPPLLRLGARYLLQTTADGRARDRVAHFHLSNGARIERLNWLGNTSAAGLSQSAGLTVNYNYKLDDIDANHEAYSGEGRITATAAIRRLSEG